MVELASPRELAVAELRVLGGFELVIGGVSVDQFAVRPRARKALHMLALHVGRPVHRDVLTQAVWPDSHPDAARRSVHVAMSSLRHLLEPEARRGQSLLLPRLGDSYTLALPAGSQCDLLDFQTALASARTARLSGDLAAERASLRRALGCYGGDLLPEDGSAEWVVAERERLRLAAADAGEQLARAEAAAGDVGTAVEHGPQRAVIRHLPGQRLAAAHPATRAGRRPVSRSCRAPTIRQDAGRARGPQRGERAVRAAVLATWRKRGVRMLMRLPCLWVRSSWPIWRSRSVRLPYWPYWAA